MVVNFWKGGKSILLFCLISIGFAVNVFAQNDSSLRIGSISIQGIEKNKESYLNQFIQSDVAQYFSDSLLLEDVQRLKNIPSIGNAYYVRDTVQQSIDVVFHIEEVNTIVPVVNFGSVKNNHFIQLGFYESNLRGKGSFLSAIYQNRDSNQHGGQVYYRADRIKGSDWGFTATLNKAASLEPLFFEEGAIDYDYANYEFGFTIIKRFGFRHQLEFGGTYFIEQFRKSKNQFSDDPAAPNSLTQPKYLSKVEYTGDFIDYHFFYLKGFYWKFALQNVYTISDQSWFRSAQFLGKYFTRVGEEANLGIRILAGVATNSDSPFAPYVTDSHINLRGIGNRTARGTALFIINAEYRLTVSDTDKWGIQLVTFLDIGTLRSPGGNLEELIKPTELQHFFGSGFRLIYKEFHGAVLRFDYGLNIQDIRQAGAVIGFGQYF